MGSVRSVKGVAELNDYIQQGKREGKLVVADCTASWWYVYNTTIYFSIFFCARDMMCMRCLLLSMGNGKDFFFLFFFFLLLENRRTKVCCLFEELKGLAKFSPFAFVYDLQPALQSDHPCVRSAGRKLPGCLVSQSKSMYEPT